MGLFDSWKQQPQQQQPQGQPPQHANMSPPAPNSNSPANGNPWGGSQNQNSPQDPQNSGGTPPPQESPLDAFKDLWQTDPNKPAPQSSAIFSLDPKKLSESVQKMNFAGTVNPELMQKAMSGDQQAFSSVLNNVTQSAFQQSLTLFTQMMEHGFSKNNSNMESKLPDLMKDWGSREELSSDPLFQHPSTKPILDVISSQIREKYPDRPAKEIAKMAQDFVKAIASQVPGTNQNSSNSSNNQSDNFSRSLSTDFSDFLS